MEYLVCFCAASLVEKERNKETEWSYGRVEKVFLQLKACAKSVVIFRPCWTCSPYGAKVGCSPYGAKIGCSPYGAKVGCSQYGAKVRFAVRGNQLWIHRDFCVSGGFGGEAYVSPKNVAQR